MSAIACTPTPHVAMDEPPEEVPWVPRMDAIRKAQLAEVDALESVVGALASKQQSAITKLRSQVDTIIAWKSQIAVRDTRAPARDETLNVATTANQGDLGKTNAHGATTTSKEARALAEAAGRSVENSLSLAISSYDRSGEIPASNVEKGTKLRSAIFHHQQMIILCVPLNEEVVFLMHRVAVLEKDLVKLQGMWDMNKGQRVIEVWMSILNRKSYKPSNIDDPVECAVITLQNWWKDMLANKLDWSVSSKSSVSSRQAIVAYHRRPSSLRKVESITPSCSYLEADHNIGNNSQPAWFVAFHVVHPGPISGEEEEYSKCDEAPHVEIEKQVQQNEGSWELISAAPRGSDHAQSRENRADDPFAALSRASQSAADGTQSKDEEMEQQRENEAPATDNNDSNNVEAIPGNVPKETMWKRPTSVVSIPTERSDRLLSSSSSHHRERGHHHHHHKDHKAAEPSGGVQGMFDGALKGNPVLMITSMAMQLQSQETELENLQNQVAKLEVNCKPQAVRDRQPDFNYSPKSSQLGNTAADHEEHAEPEQRHPDPQRILPRSCYLFQISSENFSEMGRRLGELQRDLDVVREREEEREKRTQLSLEELEALIAAKEEDSNRRMQEQAQENAQAVDKLLARLGTNADDEKKRVVCEALVELKLELRSLYSSLAAISGNEISSTQLRSMEGIRHLLASFSERARVLEEEIGDPVARANDIVANNVAARRFADRATDLGTTLFAFIKAQVLQARRAREGSTAASAKVHRRVSSAAAATAVVAANIAGGDGMTPSAAGGKQGGHEDTDGDGEGHEERVVDAGVTGASPQAWAKLGYLTYTRDQTSEKMPFPAGMVLLLKAISEVLNHCVGTGDLAIRLSVTLEDLTVYVAQRADKERESVIRQLSTPVEGVKNKLAEMEETLAGFQRTMHLVLSEVDADRERSVAIAALGTTVQTMQGLFSRLSDELESKAGASEIEKALEDMTFKINEAANEQTRLQRLGRALGKDQNSTAAMKRLRIELEQARATAILSMVPNDKDVLIGSKCLSCNRPLGGFGQPQAPKGLDEWYTGAGGLSGSRDRVVEVAGGKRGSGQGERGINTGNGGGSGSAGIGTSRSPGRTQPVITPAKVFPLGSASSSPESSGAAGRKGPQGPVLFER
ncbi:unnamed protein product, partial [Scytosiphon promiscuus]